MLDYIRIGCIVPAVQVGNCNGNAREICRLAQQAAGEKCDIALFPELCVTGYSCGDLFFQSSLLQGALSALKTITQGTQSLPLTTVVGVPLVLQGQLYNCAAVLRAGKVWGIVPKTYLPQDRSCDEGRWFHGASELNMDSLSAEVLGLDGGYDIPVGNDLIFQQGEGSRMAVEICEDLFAPISPSAVLTGRGAEVVLNLSASPCSAGKQAKCRRLVQGQSESCNCVYAYVSAGAMESTQDVVFTGQCVVAENGVLLDESQKTLPREDMLICDADLGIVRAARYRNKGVRRASSAYVKTPDVRTVFCAGDRLQSDGSLYPVIKTPFIPQGQEAQICSSIFAMQSVALARRLELLGARPVVGVSGGLDSTLALLVALEACKLLKKPSTYAVGITMPCFGTTGRTHANSLKLMELLGVTQKEISIQAAVLQHFDDMGHDPALLDTTYENAQARERTQVLMDYAGQIGGIVVGTGDMSELALGWCTYNADHMSMYGVNGGIPKTVIPLLIQWAMEQDPYGKAAPVLQDILATPISPELLPPDAAGRICQQTEDLVGPYQLHDFFLYYVLQQGFTPAKIYHLACRAFRDSYDGQTVKKWLKVFYKRFFTQQFKRSCLPEGVKVLECSLSPRGGWQMPSDAAADAWLQEVEAL